MNNYDFPNKKYNIIYADPPWAYRDNLTKNRGVIFKYPTMSFEELKNLPIQSISKNDCVIFLWTTMCHLPEALELLKIWEFEYKTCAFTWIKRNKSSFSWFFGMGHWTRSNAELCLLGKKGNIKRINPSVSSIVATPIQKHSKKPDVVRNKIIKLMGDLPRIELFAREKTYGWDVWGNEVNE